MSKILRIGWVIILDLLAVILLLFALFFGWLPGAPGIPIALAGLGLLAINHEWAKNLLEQVKAKSSHLWEKVKTKINNKG